MNVKTYHRIVHFRASLDLTAEGRCKAPLIDTNLDYSFQAEFL